MAKAKTQHLENQYCRGPIARLFNQLPHAGWHPNQNDGKGYISGRPDGFVCLDGRFIAVECKAGLGKLYLGNPANPDDTEGWHRHQRDWYTLQAVPQHMPYWIAAWVYSKREDDLQPRERLFHQKARLFLIPPSAWLAAESRLDGRMTLALNAELEREHAYKAITAESEFGEYALMFEKGQWQIPVSHLFWQALRRCQ